MSTATTTPTHTAATPTLTSLREYVQTSHDWSHLMALAAWDEKTKMPRKAVEGRARQKSQLAVLLHERATSSELKGLIDDVLSEDADNIEAKKLLRDYEQSTKIPSSLVREMTHATSHAHHTWVEARQNDDFALYASDLEHILELCRQQAEHLGYENEAYDALLDIYEEGVTAAQIEPLFEALREPTHELMGRLPKADDSILRRSYPVDEQKRYVAHIVQELGYDMDAGRVDPTAHPFCISVGESDVRLTTRYDEHWLPAGLFSTIHEAGHGIYNQSFARLGLPSPIASAPGLGMHESQSRTFENYVARSRAFWKFHYTSLQTAFPGALGDVSLDEFVAAINVASPSLIRVEADELTYNMHVGLRFELERALVAGDLKVRDLPEAWNDAMNRWVGITPDNDADGVLQDVHWSMGSFGYFPTYSLGNLYGAAFMEVARRDIPDFDDQLANGKIDMLLRWFDEHIYQHGRTYTGVEFVERITGGPITVDPLVRYLTAKFGTRA